MSLDAAMLEIEARFLLNLPEEELASVDRLFFQLEQAYWYYEDFLADAHPDALPHFSLEAFTRALFTRSECLQHLKESHEDLVKAFNSYKYSVPVYGCVCLNRAQDKVLLVCNWDGKGWTLPKGKVNEGEAPADCAAREVEEETGYDVRGRLREEDAFTMVQNAKRIHLYIVPEVPEDFPFYPQVRKEISEVKFWPINSLPKGAYGLTRPLDHVRHWQEKKRQGSGRVRAGSSKTPKRGGPGQQGPRSSSVGKGGRAKSAPGVRNGRAQGGWEAAADAHNATTFGAGDAGEDWDVEAMFAANEKLTGRKFTYDGNPQRFGDSPQSQGKQAERGRKDPGQPTQSGKEEAAEGARATSAMGAPGEGGGKPRRINQIEGEAGGNMIAPATPASPPVSLLAQQLRVHVPSTPPGVQSCGEIERRVGAEAGGKKTEIAMSAGEGVDFTFDAQDILSVLHF
jgi:mRNA-decapping enzyme subunit 2